MRNRNYGIKRVEIDFSLPSFNAVAKVFTGSDYEAFLQSMWDALIDDKKLDFVIHICRIHVLRFLRFKIQEVYRAKKHTQVFNVLRSWTFRLVRVSSMSNLVKVVDQILILVATKHRTPLVDEAESDSLSNRGILSYLIVSIFIFYKITHLKIANVYCC